MAYLIRGASLTLAWAVMALPSQAGTLHVPGDAATIQAAIVAAADGDTILVAPGTYVETIDYLGKRLVLEGTGGAGVTLLDAAGGGTAVHVGNAEPAGTALRGFTITGGSGQQLVLPDGMGGFFQRLAAGGVYVGPDAQLELDACVLTANTLGSTLETLGGGLFANRCSVTLNGCTLSDNVADNGAALSTFGDASIVMSGCAITGNTADSGRFAVSLWEGGGSVTDCLVADNTGNGLHKVGYGVTVTRCTFAGNTGWGYTHFGQAGSDVLQLDFLGNGLGGARCIAGGFGGYDAVTGSVFAGDRLSTGSTPHCYIDNSSFDGATIDQHNWPVHLRNSIVRGAGSFVGTGAIIAEYSDIEGSSGGLGNIDADPQWVDASAHDYRLQFGSPCINTGDPASPHDPDGTVADMGALPVFNPWTDLGGGVAGSAGLPLLAGQGTLAAGDGVSLTLSGTPPFTSTVLIVGASQLGVPFKDGTLWPALHLVQAGLVTNGSGTLVLGGTWPTGIPAGFSLWAQSWFADAGGPSGFAGSNGVRGTVP